MGDLVYWSSGNKGKFSIRSVISIMRNMSDNLDENCWDLIWTAPVQQQIRAFLWVACHERIMSNVMHFKCKLTNDPRYFLCEVGEETTLHILRDCPFARMLWKSLGGPVNNPEFF